MKLFIHGGLDLKHASKRTPNVSGDNIDHYKSYNSITLRLLQVHMQVHYVRYTVW